MASISESNRRKIMQSIRHENTMPEVELRKFLYACGIRYRKNYGSLPGKPDIAITSKQLAIFVHGCFWHHHQGCKRSNWPKSNKDYWEPKINNTITRDKQNIINLQNLEWSSFVIWECETKDISSNISLIDIIKKYCKTGNIIENI